MITDAILMVRPAAFGYNEETAADNFFQSGDHSDNPSSLQKKALAEFDRMVQVLREKDITVFVFDDSSEPAKPSAVFPNNWLSTSPEGAVCIYPMNALNRRPEKRDDILQWLQEKFQVRDFQDWSEYEVEGLFLEGTGSMVMDHENKIIYACLSPRTSLPLVRKFAEVNGYQAITFLAKDKNGKYIYHTNVMMCIGEGFAVLCSEAIDEEWERIAVRQLLESTGHEIITISPEQMHHFAGNMLQLKSRQGKKFLVMSRTAYDSLNEYQISDLFGYTELLPVDVSLIEKTEGGSVRCMMAEIFLPPSPKK